MTFTDAKREYYEALGKNPSLPAPRPTAPTAEALWDWKNRLRAFDAARLELGIKTPRELQEENAAVKFPKGQYRIVRHARYA